MRKGKEEEKGKKGKDKRAEGVEREEETKWRRAREQKGGWGMVRSQ